MKGNETPMASAEKGDNATMRRAWSTPLVEDADVTALTSGTGTSGVEGTPFLKAGS